MRILQVFGHFGRGGTERMIEVLAREWRTAKHEVWTWLPYGGDTISALRPLLGAGFPEWCRADVVAVHGGWIGTQGFGLVQMEGMHVVEVLHRMVEADPGATAYIAVSHAVAGIQKRVRCTVIPNGVWLPPASSSRQAIRARMNVSDDTLIVARHGRIAMEKGWHWTMRIMEEAWSSGLNVIFMVCGLDDGPTSRILRQWARGKRCRMLGWLDNPAEALLGADIYLETSTNEAFGLAVAEAGLLALPVVAFSTPSSREILGDSAMMVPIGDTTAAACALERLASRADVRSELGAALRERVRRLFDPAVCANRYLELFEQLQSGAPNRDVLGH